MIILGVIFIIIGLLFIFHTYIPFLGKLPGDFVYQGKNVQVYFPLTTSIIVSVILSIILYFFIRN